MSSVGAPFPSGFAAGIVDSGELGAVSRAAADLRERVAALEQQYAAASGPLLVGLLDRIVTMSTELFPGPVRIERGCDPRELDAPWFVVTVEAHGDFRQIIQRELAWHDKVREIVGLDAALQFGLSVIPK